MDFRNSRRTHLDAALLSAYLDNQVTPVERARVEEHLRACPTCQQELGTLRQTVTLLRAMPRVRVPRAFTLSEAQVGIRQGVARPAWPWGGMLKGLATVTAVLVVALVATTLLRQPAWTPSATVARVAPQAAPSEAPAGPTGAPGARVAEKAAVEPTAAPEAAELAAPEVTAIVEGEVAGAPAPSEAVAVPAALESAPEEAADAAVAAAPEPSEPPTQAPEPKALAFMATPGTGPASGAPEMGMAAGFGGGGAAGPELEGLAAAAAPSIAPVASALAPGTGLVYADRETLYALDAQAGLRSLLQAPGVNSPLISADGAWIAYRTQEADHVELWAVQWSGEGARLLTDERNLPLDNLPRGYGERRIHDVQWVPGQRRLAVITAAVPAEAGLPPYYELWSQDLDAGSPAYVTYLGQSSRVWYAPDGKRFALVRHGVPDGGLWLFNADGTGGKAVVRLWEGPGTLVSSEEQIHWLPDASALWAAIADSGTANQASAGIALYRVTPDGKAVLVGHLDALDANWSPDGETLAYTRAISDSLETRSLYLARADGSAPQRYATPRYWAFLGWSPDSRHFLYQDNQTVYLGAAGQAPQPLGNFLSIFDPRWVAPDQFVHLLDQGGDWVLVARWLDGRAVSLATLPRDTHYDVTRP